MSRRLSLVASRCAERCHGGDHAGAWLHERDARCLGAGSAIAPIVTTGSPAVVVLIAQAMTPEPGSKSGPLAAWPRRAVVRAGLAAATLAMIPAAACAQDYPTRAVRIIVPFPAGGTADLMPRIVATGCRANGSRP
jgi:hypothetical protein